MEVAGGSTVPRLDYLLTKGYAHQKRTTEWTIYVVRSSAALSQQAVSLHFSGVIPYGLDNVV